MKNLLTLLFTFFCVNSFAQIESGLENRFKSVKCPVTINQAFRYTSPRYKIELENNELIKTALDSVFTRTFGDFDADPKIHVVRPAAKLKSQPNFDLWVLSHSNFNEGIPEDFIFLATISKSQEIVDVCVLVRTETNEFSTTEIFTEFETETKFKILTSCKMNNEITESEEIFEIDENGKITSTEQNILPRRKQ